MAYALRYYKELIHEDGSAHRLEIHKKDSTAEAVEIGAVIQGLALEIQGSQGDVDSPIVKTSLSMTFVDAGDIEDGRKNGFWQEFYTPDALLWKVILKARTATETSFRTMWGGYVTPDSFSESLVYRGSVNIIARDNLGHMQDFPFDAVGDADGLISLRNLVEAGWEKIQSPMVLDWRGETESNMWLMCDGVPAPDTLMNVSQFEGMDWYKAIETALASYGIVMRWVGDNIVNVSSLRSMPLQGREVMDNLSQITPVFVAGAQRELVPAVRRIEESISYDLQETLSMPKLDSSAFTGDTQSYRCKIDGVDIGYGQFGTLEHDAPIWPINPNNGWSDEDDATTLFFNPKAYELGTFASRRGLGDEIYRYMYIAANNVDDRRVSFTRSITCADVTISMKLGHPCNLDILSRIEQQSVFNLKRITFAVILEQGGVTRYYNGRSWGASYAEISVDYDPTSPSYEFSQFVSMDDNAGAAELTFCIVKIEYAQTSYVGNSSVYGLYACIQDLSFNIPESSSLLSDNSVNTVYNAENNVILSRTPEIGPAYNAVALPGLIKNGIFYRSGGVILPARAWGWSGSTPQQMAVYNHLQLLCYYAKPNNLISGTIVNGDLTSGRAIYLWHGKEHLLVSGRYNLLNGMIEGAMLREFTRYEAMWGEVSETAFPDTEQDSTTNVEGGASSGGSSSTYTNTTTVNIGSGGGGGASYLNDLMDVNTDSVTAQSVLYYNGTEWVGRSLSAILNSYAKSADLLTLSNLLASMWSIDTDGNLVTDKQVIIKNNLIVKGDTASGGEGGGSSSVGIQGIVVNGVTYRDTDGDGLIDLGTIGGGGTITEITSTMITEALGYVPANSASLGSLATKDSLVASDIPSLDWSKITSGKPTTLYGYGITDSFRLINNSTYVGVYIPDDDTRIVAKNSYLEWYATGWLSHKAAKFIVNGGTSSQFLKADGSLDSTSYLSTAGGTMTGAITMSGAVARLKMNGGLIEFNDASGNFVAYLRGANNTLQMYDNTSWRTIYHSGNFNPADYLPLSGGTISGSLQIGNDDNISAVQLMTVRRGHFATFRNTVNEMILSFGETSTSTPEKMLAMGDSGLRYSADGGSAYNDILHSGNVGEYAFTTAAKTLTSSDTLDAHLTGIYGYKDGNNPTNSFGQNAAVLSLKGIKSDPVFQLAFDGNTTSVGYRNQNYAGTWTAWKTIAFTDSTVAAAKKLVDASGNDAVLITSNGSANLGLASDGRGYILYNSANYGMTGEATGGSPRVVLSGWGGVKLKTGGKDALIVNGSGNVTIGGSDLAETSAKLYVDGVLKVYEATSRRLYTKITASTIQVGRVSSYTSGYKAGVSYGVGELAEGYIAGLNDIPNVRYFFYGGNESNAPLVIRNGHVLIGTTNDAGNTLYVNGDGSFAGGLASGGYLTVGGAITANGATINGDVRINGNLVVTGDTASGGTGESTTEDSGVLTWEQEPPTGTSLTIADLTNAGITSPMLTNILNGVYHHVIVKPGDNASKHYLLTPSGIKNTTTNYTLLLECGKAGESGYTAWTIKRNLAVFSITKTEI